MITPSIENFMTKSPVIIHENTSLSRAWEILKEKSFHHLPVLNEDDNITGILSSTDVQNLSVLFNNSDAHGDISLFLNNLTVKDVMTTHVVTVQKDQSVEEANDLLLSKGIRALPVLENGKIIGIISETDVLHYYNQKYKSGK